MHTSWYCIAFCVSESAAIIDNGSGTRKRKCRRYIQLSDTTKHRIIEEIKENGYHPPAITRKLNSEGYVFSRRTLINFYGSYLKRKSIVRARGSGPKSKITPEIVRIIQSYMGKNKEATGHQLYHIITKKHGFKISYRTVLRWRRILEKSFHGDAKTMDAVVKCGLGFRPTVSTHAGRIPSERLKEELCEVFEIPGGV